MKRSHELIDWFKSNGVELHWSLYLKDDPVTGLSVYTSAPVPKNTTVVTVPASLCITTSIAHQHICELIHALKPSAAPKDPLAKAALPEPDWILLYCVLCRLAQDQEPGEWIKHLVHIPYVSHIPTIIPTPLHFSEAELVLLGATPLQAFAELRLKETKIDYVRASTLLRRYLESSDHSFAKHILKTLDVTPVLDVDDNVLISDTWLEGLELWRWAESVLTSRSFPSEVIGIHDWQGYDEPVSRHKQTFLRSPVFQPEQSYPVLIPAYDMFNHARAHRVKWAHLAARTKTTLAQKQLDSQDRVAMVLEYETPAADTQVFNNYGGKSNEEFLAGYGFTVPSTTEDVLALKLAATIQSDPSKIRSNMPKHKCGRTGHSQTYYWPNVDDHEEFEDDREEECLRRPKHLIEELKYWTQQARSDPQPPRNREEDFMKDAEGLEALERCLLAKRKAFKASQKHIESYIEQHGLITDVSSTWNPRSRSSKVRASVWRNVRQYRAGQIEILNKAVAWTRRSLEECVEQIGDYNPDDYSTEEQDSDRSPAPGW